MLYITERTTRQTDLRDNSVLLMVSLFVVAYPHEVEQARGDDDFKSFVEKARSEGRLILSKAGLSQHSEELIEVSETRKGFLIKVSVTGTPGTEDEEATTTIKLHDVSPRQPGKTWNEKQVRFEAFRLNFVKHYTVNGGDIEVEVTDKEGAVQFLKANGFDYTVG